jgi:transposase
MMANLLKAAMIETILSLHARGWSQRRIAHELGIDRDTVARHLQKAASGSNAARAPLGSDEVEAGANAASGRPGSVPVGDRSPATREAPPGMGASAGTFSVEPTSSTNASACEPWRAMIVAKLEQGLTAQRIFQDLVTEHGFTGGYYSVRRFVRRLGAKTEFPFRRLECGPGEEAQVDFGTGAPVVGPDGKRRKTHVFRVVLSHSRKAYSEVVYRQTTESFVRCLENAFWHFGGVPQRIVLDNLRAAVTKADWFEPELNPKVRSFAAHYGTVFLPTRPYMPRHKGKVERGVAYVQDNALRGRKFATLDEQNRYLLHWEQTVADTRLHGTTRRQVGKHFEEVERAALQRLPAERFPCFTESRRTVHRDGHVEVEKAYYSVPPEHLGRTVWVRHDARLVRIFDQAMTLIATHVHHEPGRFSTQSSHIGGPKISSVERGAAWLLSKIRCIGPMSLAWAEAVIAGRGIEGVRVLQGLLNLAKKHSATDLERACDIALSHDSLHLRTLRSLIQRSAAKQPTLPFLDDHPLIRNLSDYGQFVHDAFHKEVDQ